MVKPRTLAALYAVYATLAMLLLATTMPPLQNCDETAHILRADQISHLGFGGERLADGEYGGLVDSGLLTLESKTSTLRFHRENKVSRAMYTRLAWGSLTPIGFPNTAVYPPFFYLPAAALAAFARLRNIELPHALVLMRLATGFTSIAIATCAIALAGNAALWFFAVLLLPMSLAVSAAVSQDGPMLACTALAIAAFLQIQRPQTPNRAIEHHPATEHTALAFSGMCLLLMLAGMARPPYLAFALLPATAQVRPTWRLIGVACIFVCVLTWSAICASHLPYPARPDGIVDPLAQSLKLLLHPWRVFSLAIQTLQVNGKLIGHSFVGQLGWLDVELPNFYHGLAWAMLAWAACLSWVPGRVVLTTSLGLKAAAIIGAVGGVALIQYMTWTVVGSPVIDGIQGRYFLPPAVALGVFLGRPGVLNGRLALPIMIFPIISIAVTLHAVIGRYFF